MRYDSLGRESSSSRSSVRPVAWLTAAAMLLFALTGLCPVNASAAAAAPSSVEACDLYPATLSEADIEVMRARIRNLMPSRDAAVIDAIRIVNIDADTAGRTPPLLPTSFTSTTGATIEVPRGFPRLLCRMVHFTSHIMALKPDLSQGVVVFFVIWEKQCLEAKTPEPVCFARMMQLESQFPQLDPAVQGNRELYAAKIDSAMLNVMAHEVGHILLDRGEKGEVGAFSADDELRADYLAQRSVILAGLDYRGEIFMMIPLEMFVSSPASLSGRDHPAPRCRAAVSARMSRSLAPEISMLYKWAIAMPGAEPDLRIAAGGLRAEADRVRSQLGMGENFGADELRSCPALSLEGVERLKADYDALLMAIDAAAPLPEPQRTARLFAFRPATPEVATTYSSLLIFRLATLDTEAGASNSADAKQQLSALFREARARFDLGSLNVQARGLLLFLGSINAFETSAPGTDLDALIERTAADLAQAEQYLPDWMNLYQRDGYIALLRGRCDRAVLSFQAAKEAGTSLSLARLGAADPAKCAKISALMRQDLRRDHGWR